MTREEFPTKIGPKLREVLDTQKEIIKTWTYNCVKPSDYEAGEIIAKKVIEGKIVKRGIKLKK